MRFFQEEIETMPAGKLQEIQLERLQETVSYVYERVPFYRKRLDEAGVSPKSIRSLKDLERIPFTTKDDIRDTYPNGLFAQPMKNIVRIHGSSGTTGKPTIVGYTRKDLNTWSDLMARIIVAAGVSDEDIAQISFGYGLFTGALGLHQGLEKVGATVIPMSSGNTEKQLMMMEDLGTTVLVATPSYAMYLSEMVREKGLRDRLKLKIGLFGAEGYTHEMRAKIEENFGIFATENYGMSELIGPGVAGECRCRSGMHLAQDHFIAEIIDPDTGEVLPMGEKGELVITPITKEGFPLLRYRTRDITWLIPEPCECGRTHMRIAKIQGRADDMLIIKGVNVFPSQIESALLGMEQVGAHYQIVVKKKGLMDTIEVHVELKDDSLLEKFSELEKLEKSVRQRLHSVLGLDAAVKLVEPKTIERFVGKAKRVIDLRNEG